MRRLTFLLINILITCQLTLWAQGRAVRGLVISADDKEPLIGVLVSIKGTTNGVSTDLDGKFTIQASDGAVLRFTYIGMETVERKVEKGQDLLRIDMKNATQLVEEVVVVAYGVRKKGTVAGSVSVIKSDAIENTPAATFEQALQGKSTGLQVLQNSGEPSAPASFQIRGVNSINAGTTPLFILDGVAISADDFSAINPNDIESFSVLKDASSTSIYGARAANGVIVITTKRGKMGDKGRITFRGQYGFSNLAFGQWSQMNTTERLNYEEQIGLRTAGTYDREALERININWRDMVFNNAAPMQTYELNVSGGSNMINYYVSGAYYDQEGIAVGSDFKRYSLRANIEARANDWFKIGTNTALSYEDIVEADQGSYNVVTPISAARFMLPYWSPFKDDGTLASPSDGTWLGTRDNPLEWLENNPTSRNKTKITSSLFAELRPIEGLVIRSMGGIDASFTSARATSNPSYSSNYGSGMVSRASDRAYNITWTNTANYNFTVGDSHSINLLLGHEMVVNESEGFSLTSRGQSNDRLLTMTTGTTVTSWDDSLTSSAYLSGFFRGEYNYKGKYYADFSLRRDGSSKFGRSSRWANFWSLGAMWDLKQEAFLTDVNWLTSAQLLGSVGTSGNSSIPNYDHTALFTAGPLYSGMPGIAPYSRGNEDLTWEKLMTVNVGLKAGLFGRSNIAVEFYNKKTTDMLMEVPIPFGNGFAMKWDNIGAMVNQGVEIEFDVDVIKSKQFRWNVSANASYNNNKITSLYNGLDTYELGAQGLLLQVGRPMGEFYMVRYAGVNPVNGDALWLDKTGKPTTQFTNDNRVLLNKSYIAPWQGGFSTSFDYRGITLSAQFSWVADRWMVNNDRLFDESNGVYAVYNQSNKLLDRWQKPGDVTSIPRDGIPCELDSRLLEDASFLRLKNLSLSYSLPKSLLNRTRVIERVRFFGQAQNLFTFTKFSGLDPESSSNIYKASYPLSRQFSFGVEVSF